jgi:ferrous-iron efflux pump FieF
MILGAHLRRHATLPGTPRHGTSQIMTPPHPITPEDAAARDARLNVSAVSAAVMVAATLVALKLWALWATGALSVAASLADSALDLIASFAGLAAVIYAARPADDDHAFGHASAEDLAALGQAALVTISALLIAARAGERLLSPTAEPLRAEGTGLMVMGISVLLTGALVLWQRRVAKHTGSRVVAADALHYMADLLPNLGAIGALAASALWGVGQVDSAVALASSVLLLAGAARIASGAWNALMDRGADDATMVRLAQIADAAPGLNGWHDLKTRTSGARLFVQIHVEIDGTLSLHDAHAIGARLRHQMLDAFPKAEVIVHKDPA